MCHFGKTDTSQCSLCLNEADGSIEHILVLCQSLNHCRTNQFKLLEDRSDMNEISKIIIYNIYKKSVNDFTQLLVDCTTIPTIIDAYQTNGISVLFDILKFARSWCFNVHVTRMKLLGRWRPTVWLLCTFTFCTFLLVLCTSF